jgi:hypothetical protein
LERQRAEINASIGRLEEERGLVSSKKKAKFTRDINALKKTLSELEASVKK